MEDSDDWFASETDGEEALSDVDKQAIEIENMFYEADDIMQSRPVDAIAQFSKVVALEESCGLEPVWSVKALRYVIILATKFCTADAVISHQKHLLQYVGRVTPNELSAAIGDVLEAVASADVHELLEDVYGITLSALKAASSSVHMWLSISIKRGRWYLETGHVQKLQQLIDELLETSGQSLHLLDLCVLEMQLCMVTGDMKRMEVVHSRALTITSVATDPFNMAIIRECGGKWNMDAETWDAAYRNFFEACQHYQEVRRHTEARRAVIYASLANVLARSSINPFSSREAMVYQEDPEVSLMMKFRQAFEDNDLGTMNHLLSDPLNVDLLDAFVRGHLRSVIVCAAVPDVDSPAYIPDIANVTESEVREVWCRSRTPLPEYRKAAGMICLQPQWATHARTARHLQSMRDAVESNPSLKERLAKRSNFEQALLSAICKGYSLGAEAEAKHQRDIVCGCLIFDAVRRLCIDGPHQSLGGGKPQRMDLVAYALEILAELAEPSAIVAKLSEVCDRTERCGTAHLQAFNLLVTHGSLLQEQRCGKHVRDPDKQALANRIATLVSDSVPICSLGAPDSWNAALACFNDCVEDFLEDRKEHAFVSSFMAPARFYLDQIGDSRGSREWTAHGLNWYSALLHSALGIQVPFSVFLLDFLGPWSGLVDFWAGLKEDSWRIFADPENFGKDYEGIPRLKEGCFLAGRVKTQEFPRGHRPGHNVMKFGNLVLDGRGQTAEFRQSLAIYLERFAYFFERDLLVQSLFAAVLNSEVKPERAGFLAASESLYRVYRVSKLPEDADKTLVKHCFCDELFTNIDVNRTAAFFEWLNVVKKVE